VACCEGELVSWRLYDGSRTGEGCRGIVRATWLRIIVCDVIRPRRIDKKLARRYEAYQFGW
jgi:hypothetical protein